ncbi:recombinase A [Microvirga sp. KLBC 81]|nr:recombinase A [Microvirga sp. KLBC 81]
MGLAVAMGEACLGGIECEQGDVLYLALEDNERRLQKRIDKVLGPLNDWPPDFEYATEWPRANEGGLDEIRAWITNAKNPRLIIVDVLMMFRPRSGAHDNQYEADYHAIKGLQALASEFQVAIVVVHHTRKGGSNVDPFEKVSGTLGLSGAADTTIVLDRNSSGATIYGRGRDIEEIESAVEFNKGDCRWFVIGQAQEVRRTDERSLILSALMEADDTMTPADISDATGMSNQNVRQLLVSMTKAGEVRKVSRGRYIHPERCDLDHNDHKITKSYSEARNGSNE